MPKILITGKDSFIGNNYIKYSQYNDIKEISLIGNKPADFDFSDFNVVLHLAAIVHQSKRISRNEYFKVNRDLCLEVAENAKKAGVKQFVFLSTVKVYGQFISGSKPWNEDSPCFPDDAYGQSKYEAEKALKKIETPDFIVSIIRTPIVYGDGVKANMLRLIRLVEKCKILPLKSVNNTRCYTYTENLVGFIDRIIEKKVPGVFISMDDKAISTTDLVLLISNALNKKVLLFKLPDTLIRIGKLIFSGYFNGLYGSFELNNSHTKNILDFTPPVPIEEGIKRMISSFIEQKSS